MKHTTTAAQQELINSELRYRRLFESVREGILILDAETGLISDVNPCLIDMLGFSREELVGTKLEENAAFKEIGTGTSFVPALRKNEVTRHKNFPLRTKSGRLVQLEFVATAYSDGDKKVILCSICDITARKRAKAAIRAKNETHRLLIENLPAGVVLYSPETGIVLSNSEASKLLGIAQEQMLGMKVTDPFWRFVREDGTRMPVEENPIDQVIASGHLLKNFVMGIDRGSDGECIWVLVNAYPEFDSDWNLRQVVVAFTDIGELKSAEEKIRRHLDHLAALVEIVRAINFSFDLNLSLATLLTHVIVQLGVDAADVLLFNPTTQMLEYVAGRGFHTKAIEHSRQQFGEGYAGRVAQEHAIVHIPDLVKEHDSYLRGILLAGENFVSYHGVPLIAKGQIKGVLEIFHRDPFSPDEEWLDFLKTLADQAAIAIDNSTLFDKLQRSNTELAQAYDATIEGWSHALDLRDNETEGHTLRVADLTVKLARIFGLSEEELVQIRWGALLHDIGKIGVPDGILLKKDALTEEEWVVMKKHPTFAYEMLAPIRHLRLALEIPYAHHEKWDGTGYPLGLKGEQIPLAARIFAVVDVWDALISDRNYRASWPVEKVREHIRLLAGTHFDPHVVKICLESDVLVSYSTEGSHDKSIAV